MRVVTGATLLVGILLAGSPQAAIYRWVDNQGGVHYTETPPPVGNKDRGTKVRTLGAPTGGLEQGRQRSQTIQNQLKDIQSQREKATEEQAKQEEEATRRETNCKVARQNLANLEIRTNRRLLDKEGNVTAITEEERAKRIEEARAQIEENCS